jgi:hypothetical protein
MDIAVAGKFERKDERNISRPDVHMREVSVDIVAPGKGVKKDERIISKPEVRTRDVAMDIVVPGKFERKEERTSHKMDWKQKKIQAKASCGICSAAFSLMKRPV